MASSEERIFNKVMVSAAMSLVSEKFPEEYQKAISDSDKEREIKEVATKHVVELTKVIRNVRDKKMKSWAAFSHLSVERMERIRQALGMKTFEMKIKKSCDAAEVEVTRGENPFRPTMKLSTPAEMDAASDLQIASIVVECVILVLEVMGVDIDDNEEEVQKAINIALDHIRKSKDLIDDVDEIQQAYEKSDYVGMATAIVKLVIDVFDDGIFWDITKALLSDMPWYDWVLTAAKIAAEIAAIVATGGAAEIAELVSILVDATFFLMKLQNLASFKAMKKETPTETEQQ